MTNAAEDNVVLYKEGMSVQALADALGVSGTELIKKIMGLGLMLSLSNAVDYDTCELIASEYGKKLKRKRIFSMFSVDKSF